jgi:hypothetical protein
MMRSDEEPMDLMEALRRRGDQETKSPPPPPPKAEEKPPEKPPEKPVSALGALAARVGRADTTRTKVTEVYTARGPGEYRHGDPSPTHPGYVFNSLNRHWVKLENLPRLPPKKQ